MLPAAARARSSSQLGSFISGARPAKGAAASPAASASATAPEPGSASRSTAKSTITSIFEPETNSISSFNPTSEDQLAMSTSSSVALSSRPGATTRRCRRCTPHGPNHSNSNSTVAASRSASNHRITIVCTGGNKESSSNTTNASPAIRGQ